MAGVSSHYHGHQSATSQKAKAEMYAQTIRFLDRARPAYDFEPRVYVYLAVSHYRLGHQLQAEQLIERAIPLAVNDPDVYYCRAEIRHRKDPAAAAKDIERYLAMIDQLAGQGVPVIKSKHERVQRMLANLRRGAPSAAGTDMFDPLPQVGDGPSPTHRRLASPRTFALAALAVALVVGGAVLVVRRTRRRTSG